MEFRSDESGARSSDRLIEPASTTMVELDLFDELSNFSALSSEEQRKDLERIGLASAQPAPTAGKPAPANFDFIEQSDWAEAKAPTLDQFAEPTFDLIDESLLEPPDLPDPPPAQPVFAFVEQPAQQVSQPIEDGRFASEPPDTLGVTSPLADIFSGVILTLETALSCENCGADSGKEDLFCLSCGELVGEID
ncbi:MAG: hypothetical protein AABO41_05720 [Acidobacteriota bacterium]